MPNINNQIEDAIRDRQILTCNYDGLPRQINPHCYGENGQNHSLQLHCWQTKGDSRKGRVPGWKNFEIDKIQNLIILDQNFEPENNYTIPKSYAKVITSILDVPFSTFRP